MDVDAKSGTKRCQNNLEDAESASKPRLETSQSPGQQPAGGCSTPAMQLVGQQVAPDDRTALLLQEAPKGWHVRECGGGGDCAFLAVASAISWLQNKSLDAAALAREAATLRLYACAHMTKHDEYAEAWAPDPEEQEHMTAGAGVPGSFNQYSEACARKGYWADTFMLHALACRIGRPIIIWKWASETKSWCRGVVAPWYRDGFAQGARQSKPICLLLSDGHFQALVHETKADPPLPWTRESVHKAKLHPRASWRGAGPRSNCSLPSRTPSRSVEPGPNLRLLGLSACSRGTCKSSRCAQGLSLPASSPQPPSSMPKSRSSRGDSRVPGADDSGLDLPPSTPRASGSARSSGLPSTSNSNPSQVPSARDCQRVPATRRSAPIAASQGDRVKWWECDCGFVVYKHPVIKSHHESRKLHLHKAHGVPWDEIPPPPKPTHSASSAATQKAFEGRWKILWAKFQASRWPGAHDISVDSSGHPPKHWCKACMRLVRRSDIVSEVCTKHRFRSDAPALKARRKLWGAWSKAARKEATKQRRDQRAAALRKAKIDSNQSFRACSTARKSTDKPAMQLGLPMLKSSRPQSGNWWKCKYCDFAIPASAPTNGRSSTKSRHLWNMHGLSNQPLPRGGLETLPTRVTSAQDTYRQRWSLIWKAYVSASWAGAHQVAEDPAHYKIFTSKTGHQWSQPMHQCTVCSQFVARNRLPVEVCPALKGSCKPTSSTKRKREWKLFREAASKATRRTPLRKTKKTTVAKNPGCHAS